MKPIDFVIPWVDGNDPKWQSEKQKHNPNSGQDADDIRYRDWDNLQYFFRGVEKFAPWVHKIHFVTWGHVPKWLNTAHPKLNIVNHKDFIPKEYLPTFSANPIELNLHRIPELSEQFVYFNDDMFITRSMKPTHFFKDGVCKDRLALSAITPNDDSISSIMFNDVKAINRHFSKQSLIKNNLCKILFPHCGVHSIKTIMTLPFKYFTGFYDDHLPYAYTKSLFQEVWENESATLHTTCQNKFRGTGDVNQWLMRYWRMAKGDFVKCSGKQGKMWSIIDNNAPLFNAIMKQKYYMVCCNDGGEYTSFQDQSSHLKSALAQIMPEQSSFEA